jgi:predicted ATPase
LIHRLRIANFKALRDVSVDLGSLHVLIGPNDTGKTSILQAAAALCRSVDQDSLAEAFLGPWDGRELAWRGQDLPITLVASISDEGGSFEYEMVFRFGSSGRRAVTDREEIREDARIHALTPGADSTAVHRIHFSSSGTPDVLAARRVYKGLSGVRLYRWNPRFLALPVAQQERQQFWIDPSGFGLALLLDDILGFDRAFFERIEQRFRALFPHVKSIRLQREAGFTVVSEHDSDLPELKRAPGKGLYFEFTEGEVIRAAQVSDGMLVVLAFLTILNLPEPPRVLLVEEPENGVHPKRLRDVLTILSEIVSRQQRTQVLLTTHSPYVVDQFAPEDVSLCSLGKDGAVALTPLSTSPTVLKQLDVFTLGEIWTAEGDEELAQKSPATE